MKLKAAAYLFLILICPAGAADLPDGGQYVNCSYRLPTPPYPSGVSIVRFGQNTSGPRPTASELQTVRETVWEINASRSDLPFRVYIPNDTQPLQILYRNGESYQVGPVLRPGTSIDVAKGKLYARAYCAAGSPCENNAAIPARCRRDDGRWVTRSFFYTGGYHVLLSAYPRFRGSEQSWKNESPRFNEWYSDPVVTILDSESPKTYRLWGPPSAGNVIIDGEDTGPLQPNPLRYYEGRLIEVRLANPAARVELKYRFVSE